MTTNMHSRKTETFHGISSVQQKSLSVRPLLLLFIIGIALVAIMVSSCEELYEPDQDRIRREEDMFRNWEEYRSAEMGLYSLQQDLVEQVIILGELRGDLLKITNNANPDLVEVYNFNISKNNTYASPVKFYKLITSCNKLINKLESAHPNVMDKTASINNYDRLYGEALCMRAWAYFNAVRIYGIIPYIHESLETVKEIEDYVNSGVEFVDSVYIDFAPDGYQNDTIRDTTIVLKKKYLNQRAVIDTFTYQLENRVKAVGVNHSINIGDISWLVTVWNDYARHVLLGKMYFYDGNYAKAIEHFDPIMYNYTSETSDIKFGLDGRFQKGKWKNIFTGIDSYEHIYSLWFGKSHNQQHEIQSMFSVIPPNEYMMKPTSSCIRKWESIWNDPEVDIDYTNPVKSKVINPGIPGDFYRGYGISYKYYKDGKSLSSDTVQSMLLKKMNGNYIDVQSMMIDVDTVVNKYSIGKNRFSRDAHFNIYRAADVHLYAAEIYAVWKFIYGGLGIPRTQTNTSLNILNDGLYGNRDSQLGVRGRVGFADGYEQVKVGNYIFIHDPVTNEIVDYYDFTGKTLEKQEYLVDKIIEERARELAFEGERFYDLMRIARRRNDPSYLADRVAEKFSGAKKEAIRQKLMNEENWYIDFY
jgi:hypothetical protein